MFRSFGDNRSPSPYNNKSFYECPYCGILLDYRYNEQSGKYLYYCPNCRDWYADYEIEPDEVDSEYFGGQDL